MKFTTDLYARMSEALEQLAMTSDNILQRAERSYNVVEQTLGELKEFIIHYTFKDKQEEIKFFKEIKPAASMIEVKGFIHPDLLIEIEVTAIIDK